MSTDEQQPYSPASEKLRRGVLALIDEYERDRDAAARQKLASGTSMLMTLAVGHARADSIEARANLAEQVGSSLDLDEAGTIRRVAKVVETALPSLVVDAHVRGQSASEIARELGYTNPSYVHRILRDNPWNTHWVAYRGTSDGGWKQLDCGDAIENGTADQHARRMLPHVLADESLATSRVRILVWREGDDYDPATAPGNAEHNPDDQP